MVLIFGGGCFRPELTMCSRQDVKIIITDFLRPLYSLLSGSVSVVPPVVFKQGLTELLSV